MSVRLCRYLGVSVEEVFGGEERAVKAVRGARQTPGSFGRG
jgi:hypothetical protein